jgi:hypothetical protein
MSTGHQLDRLAQFGVPGHRAMMRTVHTHDLGQHVRVPGIRLRPRRGVPLPVAGHRHRVDREHLVPSSDQRRHPLPAVGLDPDLHPRGHLTRLEIGPLLGEELGDQRMKASHPVQALGQPFTSQPAPLLIDDLHVVMVFSPVITDEQHSATSRAFPRTRPAARRRHPAS